LSALDLQSALIKELTVLFDGQEFMEPKKTDDEATVLVPLNLYKQSLPYTKGDNGNAYAPFIAVQILSCKQDDETEPQDVTISFDIGIYDNDKSNEGHITVCNIIETIQQDLFLKRLLNGKYYVKPPFSWQLNSEDVWPYFAGSIETHWNLPLTVPDDPNL
jgi:hypothetical protein